MDGFLSPRHNRGPSLFRETPLPRTPWRKGMASLLRQRRRDSSLGTPTPGEWGILSLCRLQPHVNVLLLRIGQQFLETFLAANAGLFVAAERRAEEMLRDFVDPDKARLHGGRGAVRGGNIVGPDRSGQPVFDGVHLFKHLGFIAPFENRE